MRKVPFSSIALCRFRFITFPHPFHLPSSFQLTIKKILPPFHLLLRAFAFHSHGHLFHIPFRAFCDWFALAAASCQPTNESQKANVSSPCSFAAFPSIFICLRECIHHNQRSFTSPFSCLLIPSYSVDSIVSQCLCSPPAFLLLRFFRFAPSHHSLMNEQQEMTMLMMTDVPSRSLLNLSGHFPPLPPSPPLLLLALPPSPFTRSRPASSPFIPAPSSPHPNSIVVLAPCLDSSFLSQSFPEPCPLFWRHYFCSTAPKTNKTCFFPP